MDSAVVAPGPLRDGRDDEHRDERLVAGVRAGDERAFERLFEGYRRAIASFVYRRVNDHGWAEDITQEVFISALRQMRASARPICFRPWIYEIARNACIDQFRRAQRATEICSYGDDRLGRQAQDRLIATSPEPPAAIDLKERIDDLRCALDTLSETHHDVIVLRELEGRSYGEIGERLGMTRPAVESTLFRARRRLTEEYRELEAGVHARERSGGAPLGRAAQRLRPAC